MKVAHVIGKMKTAGVEAVVFTYLRNMPLDNIEAHVLYDADSEAEIPSDLVLRGVKFIEIPPYQKIFDYLSFLKKLFKNEKYDIVHSHMNVLSVFCLWAAKCAGVPCRICHNHNMTSPRERKRNIMKLTLRPFSPMVATDLAACSELCGRWMFGNRRYDSGKVKLFYNAIKAERFKFDTAGRAEIRDRFGVGDSVLLGHVGRFFSQKNHGFLIDILVECLNQNIDAKLLLVGEGENLADVRQKAENLGITDHVIFQGVVGDVEKYYSAMDMFLLPSLYEGLPVVSMEAQASGLPCILSDRITRECAISDKVDFLPIDSVAPWVEKISKFSPQSREEAYKIFDDTKFNINNSARDMVQYYLKITNNKQG